MLLPILALAACSLPSRRAAAPAAAPPASTAEPRTGSGEWGDRVLFDAVWTPAVWLESDSGDENAVFRAIGSADGSGYGLRAAVGNREQSIGLLYHGLDLEADDGDLLVHQALLDFDVRLALAEGGGSFHVLAGAGIGGVWLDLDRGREKPSVEGASQLRLGLGFAPSRWFAAHAGLGGLLYGHPGDTKAYGSFLMIGATLTF